MNCSAQPYSARSTVNSEGVYWEEGEGGSRNKTTSSLIYVSDVSYAPCARPSGTKYERGDRPRLFIIIAIWAGFVLTENRGNTVTRARVSSSIGIMHPYWGL